MRRTFRRRAVAVPPGTLGKRIAQGSGTVYINNYHAARQGDKGTCDFTLGQGCATVIIGGPTVTVDAIDPEVPVFVDDIITGMTLVGTALLMWPGAVAMFGAGAAAGLSGGFWMGAANVVQVGLRLGAQFYVGMKLSQARGEIGHGTAAYFGAEDGSLASDLATQFGATAAPFAGGGIYKGIAETPLPGARVPGAVPEGIVDPAASAEGVQRGPTGARTTFDGTPKEQARADAAYDRIRADNGDVARISQNTGYPEEHVARVKDHVFHEEHDVLIGNDKTGDLQTSRQRFEPDPQIADRWTKAADGTLGEPARDSEGNAKPGTADPTEAADFHALMAHEYVEQGLMADGRPYRSAESWGQGKAGWNFYPDGQNAGAHDLAPLAGPDGKDPFSHYEKAGRSSEGIPRPNEDLSNLDDVLRGVRRSLGEQGGPEGSGGPEGGGPKSSGPEGEGGPAGGEKPSAPAGPLPTNVPEGRAITPAPEAEPVAVSEAVPGEPLPPTAPQGPTPEPAPEAERPSLGTRSGRGRSTVDDETLDGWARQYADNINSNRVWNWNENMDTQIPRSARAAIKQRAVDNGLITDIPVNSSTTSSRFADFRGHIRTEVQMPEFVTKPDGTRINLWKSTDPVQFRWLDEQVRQTDPSYTNHSDEGYTWHHHEGGGTDEGAAGPGRPDGRMQLVEQGIHNATNHSGGRSDGRWADAPR